MKRKDAILVAVLINAGLLVLLFSTALSSERTEKQPKQAIAKSEVIPVKPAKELKKPSRAQPKPVVKEIARQVEELDAVIEEHPSGTLIALKPTKEEVVESPNSTAIAPTRSVAVAPSTPKSVPPVVKPVAQQAKEAAAIAKIVDVTVKRGDSLDKIARGNGTTVSKLMELNGLSDSRLQIGQVLKVSVEETKPVVAKVPAAEEEGSRYYTIVSGDNPWLIATKFHIPLEELLALNGLDETSAKRLKPGDRVRIQ